MQTIVPPTLISHVAWSRDRTSVALIRPLSATKQTVEIRTRAGSRRTLLTADAPTSFSYGIAWSPDGTSLALLAHDRRERGVIERIDRRTLRRRVVARNVGVLGPIDWSPRGDSIVLQGTRPRPFAPLALVAVRTGRVRRVGGPKGRSPSFSPDGRRVAYSANDGIVVLELATGRLRQVTTGGWQDDEPAWSPDGTMLVYSHAFGHCFTAESGPPCNFELFMVPVAGGKPVNVTGTPKQQERTPAWLG